MTNIARCGVPARDDRPSELICEALVCGDVTACGRCDQSWPTAAKSRPLCLAKAKPAIWFEEMRRAVVDHGTQLGLEQERLVRTGDRTRPYMPALRLRSVMLAIGRLIDAVKGDRVIQDRIFGRGQVEHEADEHGG